MQAADCRRVIAAQVLVLPLLGQVRGIQRLEADEETAESGLDRTLEEPGGQHGVHRGCRLPEPAHAAHAVEERGREPPIAEQVIVEEVQVTARESLDLGQRRIDGLGIEGAAPFEECLLVTEVAHVRTAARDHDRVRHQVQSPLDQIPPDRRQPCERADAGSIRALGLAPSEVSEEARPRVLSRANEDRVGVQRRFLRQRRDVQPAERDVDATAPVVVRNPIGAPRGGDVDLNHDEVRRVRDVERLDVLVLDLDVGVVVEVPGQRRQAEGREERVLDGAPEGAGRLGQRGKDHLHFHSTDSPTATTETSRVRGPSSSTRKTRCHRPSASRPSTTLRHADVGNRRARQCACPLGGSPARTPVRRDMSSCA